MVGTPKSLLKKKKKSFFASIINVINTKQKKSSACAPPPSFLGGKKILFYITLLFDLSQTLATEKKKEKKTPQRNNKLFYKKNNKKSDKTQNDRDDRVLLDRADDPGTNGSGGVVPGAVSVGPRHVLRGGDGVPGMPNGARAVDPVHGPFLANVGVRVGARKDPAVRATQGQEHGRHGVQDPGARGVLELLRDRGRVVHGRHFKNIPMESAGRANHLCHYVLAFVLSCFVRAMDNREQARNPALLTGQEYNDTKVRRILCLVHKIVTNREVLRKQHNQDADEAGTAGSSSSSSSSSSSHNNNTSPPFRPITE
jgi:hypothetical protein